MVVLTGGGGFIGSCFLAKLNQMGIDRVLVVDDLNHDSKVKNLQDKKYSDFVQKEAFLQKVSSNGQFDAKMVFHLGACTDTTETNADYLARNNLQYSQELCQWAMRKDVRFFYASSAAIYGDGAQGYSDADEHLPELKPLNLYGESKYKFDLWLWKKKLTSKVIGFRYFNVYGPNEYHKGEMRSVVHKAYGQVKKDGVIRLFESHRADYAHGGQRRDFVYVKDILEIMGFFLEHPDKAGIYNLGTGKANEFNDLTGAIFEALGVQPRIEYFPMPEVLRGKYQYFTQADLTKLRAAGWERPFMPLKDAVKDYIQNYLERENPHL